MPARCRSQVERIDLGRRCARPRTAIMVNLGNPDLAFQTAMLPNDGVGLARMEFIISEHIKAHPMALRPSGAGDRRGTSATAIARLTAGYPDGGDFFVERLSEGIGTIAAAFYPKPVIVRLSDFKTNEYASLIGGARFEPNEENPMLGLPRRLALCPSGLRARASRWNARRMKPRARGRWD